MTIGKFARKYGIPYIDVRRTNLKAAQVVPSRAWETEFAEEDLRRMMKVEYGWLVSRYQYLMNEAAEKLARLERQPGPDAAADGKKADT